MTRIMHVFRTLSLIILVRPSQTGDASTGLPVGTGCFLRDFINPVSGASAPASESTHTKANPATTSGLNDNLELRLNTGPRSSIDLKARPSSVDSQDMGPKFMLNLCRDQATHDSMPPLSPHYVRLTGDETLSSTPISAQSTMLADKLQVPEGNINQAFWTPRTVTGVTQVEKATGTPHTHLTLEPHNGPELSIQLPGDKKLREFLGKQKEVNSKEAFWFAETITVVTQVEKETGKPISYLTLYPNTGPKMSNQYPEEKMLRGFLDNEDMLARQLEEAEKLPKRCNNKDNPRDSGIAFTLPFSFSSVRSRETFEKFLHYREGRRTFVYASDEITSEESQLSRNARQARRFSNSKAQGERELIRLYLPSTLYADGIVDHPSKFVHPRKRYPSSRGPQEADVFDQQTNSHQEGDGNTKPGELQYSPSQKRRKLFPNPPCFGVKNPAHLISSPNFKAVKAWINYTLPTTIHTIRVFYAIFPDLVKQTKKTIRQLQWDSWFFYYILLNNVEVLHQAGSGKDLWKFISDMDHEDFVEIIDWFSEFHDPSTMSSYLGSLGSKKMLLLYLSFKHQTFYRKHCCGTNGLNQRISSLLNNVEFIPED